MFDPLFCFMVIVLSHVNFVAFIFSPVTKYLTFRIRYGFLCYETHGPLSERKLLVQFITGTWALSYVTGCV